jgi:hypothetical protein
MLFAPLFPCLPHQTPDIESFFVIYTWAGTYLHLQMRKNIAPLEARMDEHQYIDIYRYTNFSAYFKHICPCPRCSLTRHAVGSARAPRFQTADTTRQSPD